MGKFKYFQDSSHGWVEVPLSLLRKLKIDSFISPYSYKKEMGRKVEEKLVYLEEDGDLLMFALAFERHTHKAPKFERIDEGLESHVKKLERYYHPRYSFNKQTAAIRHYSKLKENNWEPLKEQFENDQG